MISQANDYDELIQETITHFWETFPPTWGSVRRNLHEIITKNFDVNVEQFHILRLIWRGTNLVSDLAEVKQISRPAVSQAVDGLVEKGLISRQQDVLDRRFIRLRLTPAGEYLLNCIFQKNRAWMAERLSALSLEELAQVNQALGLLKTILLDPQNEAVKS